MCRLFGLIANKPVNVHFSFFEAEKPFKETAEENPDGWGIGWYENGHPKIEKEPLSAYESDTFDKKVREVISPIIISHVRMASVGEKSKENTHPFGFNNWIFAHNGTIRNRDFLKVLKEKLKKKYYNSIQGETDSEVYFLWLLQNIEDKNGDIKEAVKEAVSFIRKHAAGATLNFLLSDGENLYAFKEGNSLYYLIRDPKGGPLASSSDKTSQLIESKSLSNEKAVIVCSEKLTRREKWIEMKNHSLLIVDKNLQTELVDISFSA